MKPILSRTASKPQALKDKHATPSLLQLEFSPSKPKISKSFDSSSYSYLEKLTALKQSIDTSSSDQASFSAKTAEISFLTIKVVHELIHGYNSSPSHFLILFQENSHVINLILSTNFLNTFKLTQLEAISSSLTNAFNSLLSKLLSEHSTTTIIKNNSFKSTQNSYFYPFDESSSISKSDMFQFVSLYKSIMDEFPVKHHRQITTMFSDLVSYYLINKVFILPNTKTANKENSNKRTKTIKPLKTGKESPFAFIRDDRELYGVDINIDNFIDLVTFHKDNPKKYIQIFLQSLLNLDYTLKEAKVKELTKRLLEETFRSQSLASNFFKHLFSIHALSFFKDEVELLIIFTFKGSTNILSSQYSENFVHVLTLITKLFQNKGLELEYNVLLKTTVNQCVTFLNKSYNKPSIIDFCILCLGFNILEDEEQLLNNSMLNLLQIEKIIQIKIKMLNEQKNKTLNLDLYYKIINKLTNIYYNKKSNKRKIILAVLLNINFILQFYFNNIFIVLDFINSIYQFETSSVQSSIKKKLCEAKLSDNTILYIFLRLKHIHFNEYQTLKVTDSENLNVKFAKLYLTNQYTNTLYDPIIMTTYALLKKVNNLKDKSIDIYYISEIKKMFNKVMSVINYSKHTETIKYLNKEALNTIENVLINNSTKFALISNETSKLLKKWVVFYIKTNPNNTIVELLRKNAINNYPVTDLLLYVFKELNYNNIKNDVLNVILKWLFNPNNISNSSENKEVTRSVLYNFVLLVKYMNIVQKDERMYSLLTARLETILSTLNKTASILITPDNIKLIYTNKELNLLLKVLIKELYKLLSSKYLYLNFSFILSSLLTFIKRAAKVYIPYTDIENTKYIIKSLIFLYESSILVPRSESKRVIELVFCKADFELRIIVQLYITQLLKIQKSNYETVLNDIIYVPFSDTFGKERFAFNMLKDNFREFLNVYYKVDLTAHSNEIYNYNFITRILENIIDKFLDCVLGEKYEDLEKYILSSIIAFYEIMKLKNSHSRSLQMKTTSSNKKGNLRSTVNVAEMDKGIENSILRPFMAVGDMLCSLEAEDSKITASTDFFIAFFGCVYKNHKHKNVLYKINKLINIYLDGKLDENHYKREMEMIYKFKNIIIDIVII
eukprot:GAHX01001798.1.p1 GENE.GAHX01001798.1~~GAHX01001798.1.p1  ORF type:complete len:1145 (-),score=257.09 GAHX01001798.1:513-3887(-)